MKATACSAPRLLMLGLVGMLGCGDGSAATAPDAGSMPDASQEPDELGFIDPGTGCLTFNSTFDAIQSLVFKKSGCTNAACHGDKRSGGLDLRIGQAYHSLLRQPSVGSALARVEPGSASSSFLFQKLQAATSPEQAPEIAGAPMPVGLPALSADQLEAVRLWIQGGAPEEGSVGVGDVASAGELERLLGACLPEVTPVAVEPLPPPPVDKGVQFVMPTFPIPKATEREVCFAQYYDFSDVVPARFQDGESFFANGSITRQDAQSHHLTVQHSGLGPDRVHDPEFGAWTCKGGARAGSVCDPLDQTGCGTGLCGSDVVDNIACIGFGPEDAASGFLGNVSLGGLGGTGSVLPPRDGAFRKFPIRGILYWNSHAFNLTNFDHTMHVWLNLLLTDDLRFEAVTQTELKGLYDAAGQPPYTVQTYCRDHIAPIGAQMIRVSSHTHKRGKRFTIDLPDGTRFYESLSYSDPLTFEFEPALLLDSEIKAERTFRYCATFNNGVGSNGLPDTETVTRLSRMPARATCAPTHCAAGKVGDPCGGADDDATCDTAPGAGDGWCDACPITRGVTTEDEMFLISPTYLMPPAD